MIKGRTTILEAIRSAISQPSDRSGVSSFGPEASIRRSGTLDRAGLLHRLHDRLVDYRASVTRCTASNLARAVAQRLSVLEEGSVVIPSDLPASWLQEHEAGGQLLLRDGDPHLLEKEELASARGAVSGCALAIAETGTLVLAAGATQGRRILTLLPDYHLCVVLRDQVVETVSEGVARMEVLAVQDRAPITLVSGPSATSDIELIRVEGVHGPRTLDVILVEDS